MYGGQTFRSYSKNVSAGGLLLENEIPWSLPGQICKVYLHNEGNEERIEFRARVISDAANPFRISFENPSPSYVATLENWMGGSMHIELEKTAA